MDEYTRMLGSAIRRRSTVHAPWYVISANSKWFRNLAISEIVRVTMENMKSRWPEPSIEVEPARRALKQLP